MGFMDEFNFWLGDDYFDQATKDELLKIKDNESEIEERFYKELEFGTGGLRGVIGAGTNRMNIYTVGAATQGLANYLKEAFADPDTGMAPTIMEIDPAQIDDYYSVCEARIASLMAMEQPDSPAVQRKAVEMYRRVEKPFAVYPGMSSTILDYQNIMGFLVLLFCRFQYRLMFFRSLL